MFKYLLLISCLLIVPLNFATSADNPCLKYEPVTVEIKGHVREVIFPGRPNYEIVKNGDEPELYWVLYLTKEICVKGDSKDVLNSETENNVKLLQLMINDYNKYRNLLGKNVVVKGEIMHALTGHHHTPVLIRMESMTQMSNAD